MNHNVATCMIAAIVGSSVLVGCRASPAGPTNSRLEIRPQTSGLTLSDTEEFGLFQVSANGDAKRLDATWSVDRSDIVTVDATGRTMAMALGSATLAASTAGQTVPRTVRVVPNLAGNWRGELRLLDDTRISGDGPFRPAVGLKAPLEFDLQQTHDVVSGTGVVLAPLPTGAVGPVTADWVSISTVRLHRHVQDRRRLRSRID